MDGESGQEDGLRYVYLYNLGQDLNRAFCRDITTTKVNTNQAAVKLTSKKIPAPKGKAG
jgi:hypothetical protein